MAGPESPPFRRVARIEPQTALLLLALGAVAFITVVDQDRADFLLEEIDPFWGSALISGHTLPHGEMEEKQSDQKRA